MCKKSCFPGYMRKIWLKPFSKAKQSNKKPFLRSQNCDKKGEKQKYVLKEVFFCYLFTYLTALTSSFGMAVKTFLHGNETTQKVPLTTQNCFNLCHLFHHEKKLQFFFLKNYPSPRAICCYFWQQYKGSQFMLL